MANIFDQLGLDENAKKLVEEAWNSKLEEAKQEVETRLRDEFASKFEYEKSRFIDAIDTMVNESLKNEIVEFVDDRKKLVEERVAYKKKISEHAEVMKKFVVRQLNSEIKELNEDRKAVRENLSLLENFVIKNLTSELTEFKQDKDKLVESRVKLIAEGKSKIEEARKAFIKRAAGLVEKTIKQNLTKEISQLHEDIKAARENHFGKKLFEAFAAEFMTSHLAEGTEIRKAQKAIAERDRVVAEAQKVAAAAKAQLDEQTKRVGELKKRIERDQVLSSLLETLTSKKREIMRELLESVPTDSLKAQFKKFLPSVINDTAVIPQKTALTEGALREVTGDKEGTRVVDVNNTEASEVDKIIRLSGLSK